MDDDQVPVLLDVEVILKSGREVFLALEEGRDTIEQSSASLVFKRQVAPGVDEVTTVERDALAMLKVTRRQPAEEPAAVGQSSLRTLGRDRS